MCLHPALAQRYCMSRLNGETEARGCAGWAGAPGAPHTSLGAPWGDTNAPSANAGASPAVQRIVQSHLEGGLAGGDSSDGEADDGEHELARACDPDSALEPGEWDGDVGVWGTWGQGC